MLPATLLVRQERMPKIFVFRFTSNPSNHARTFTNHNDLLAETAEAPGVTNQGETHDGCAGDAVIFAA